MSWLASCKLGVFFIPFGSWRHMMVNLKGVFFVGMLLLRFDVLYLIRVLLIFVIFIFKD